MHDHSRRRFLQTAGALTGAGLLGAGTRAQGASPPSELPLPEGPIVIASANGLATVAKARQLLIDGADPTVAVVEGVGIVEADPNDMSVGLGGLPNADGIVELDASVMHGPTHKAGAVGALRDTVHAAQVALKVLQTTDHVMLVGQGATKFARMHGFPKQDMLTPKSRQAWLRWRNQLSPNDDWLNDEQRDWDANNNTPIPHTTGTIHCSAIDAKGDLGSCTTTSGLSYKIPGRVGDSPIIGAGMYCDNQTGAAGATGRGEAVIQSCGSHSVVTLMAAGMAPAQACLEVARTIAQRSKLQRRLVDAQGRPKFNIQLYALRKDGLVGGASIWSGSRFAVADAKGARLQACEYLFKRS